MARHTFQILISLVALSIACATSPEGTDPDDMSADEHRAHAEQERKTAVEHNDKYNPAAMAQQSGKVAGTGSAGDVYWDDGAYNPTATHRDDAAKHQDLAAQHEAAAAALESFEDAECKSFPSATRSVCPLLGPVAGVEDTEGGVRLRIQEGVPVDAVVGHVKCHFAFGRTRGHEGMEACPLYIKGLRVAPGDGYIDLLVDDPALVQAVRERAAAHANGAH